MTSPISAMAIDTFVPMLRSLAKIFDKAAQHARARSFDGAVLANARLAPDMFPLTRQVQIACDTAKNGTARLMGKEAPKFEDNEQTLDQLKARIERTIEYLEKADRGALQGAEDREITIPFPDGRVLEMKGLQPAGLDAAALLFPRGHGLRHPAPQRRRHRQVRLSQPRGQRHPVARRSP